MRILLKVKIWTSLFIFSFIIFAMFILNGVVEEKNLLNEAYDENGIEILKLNDEQVFKPREYIRIRKRKTADTIVSRYFILRRHFNSIS